jgi:hypothetical protein
MRKVHVLDLKIATIARVVRIVLLKHVRSVSKVATLTSRNLFYFFITRYGPLRLNGQIELDAECTQASCTNLIYVGFLKVM